MTRQSDDLLSAIAQAQYANAGIHDVTGFAIINIEHPLFNARLLPLGAQLISFETQGRELLWSSKQHQEGTPFRGGIPICLPWFAGENKTPNAPKHGLVRTAIWQLSQYTEGRDSCYLLFELNVPSNAFFEISFSCKLHITLKQSGFHYQLEIHNQSTQAMPLSFALHSYFYAEQLSAVALPDFKNLPYLDSTANATPCKQDTALRFEHEIDRIYLDSPNRLTLPQQLIVIDSHNTPSTICWNPGATLAQNIGDIQQQFSQFFCVEKGAVNNDAVSIAAGEHFCCEMSISLYN